MLLLLLLLLLRRVWRLRLAQVPPRVCVSRPALIAFDTT